MKLFDLVTKTRFFTRLNLLFPAMVETSKSVEVIPWRPEFAVADRNPEVIEASETLERLLGQGLISRKRYEEESRKLIGYASRTLAVAIRKERKVSFRDETPSDSVVIHELGHIHFDADDILWSRTCGGGEALLLLALEMNYRVTEENIRHFHHLIQSAYSEPDRIHTYIAGRIAPHIGVYPHLFPIMISAGYLPDPAVGSELPGDLRSEEWERVEVHSHHIFTFLQNVVDGLRWRDPFLTLYAELLNLVERCPECGLATCECDRD